MKRFGYLMIVLLVGILFAGTIACYAQRPTNTSSPDLDGYVWQKSSDQEKKAFLYGAGSAIALEYHVRAKRMEEPSRFVKGWVETFKDTSWSELATKVDEYYMKNPEKRSTHVFNVIWHELIAPRLQN